jgi:pyridoxine/pyridoxamine 5'-phosphate oxidase
MTSDSVINIPDSYSNVQETLNVAEIILSDAVDNSKTLFHTLVVSSFNGSRISSRVMVLREFDMGKKIMRFHTDYRAPKTQQFLDESIATVIGYDPNLKVQIKLQGKINVNYDNEIAHSAWKGSTNRSKKCYSVKGGSSKQIKDPNEYDIQEYEVESGYKNFSVLIFSFDSLEFLYLKRSGHRRAIHKWNDRLESYWLVP